MTADTAKYPPYLADIDPKSVEITAFSGIGAISTPYRLDRFRLAGAPSAVPSDWRGGDYCGAKHINVFKKHILNIGLQRDTGGKIVPTEVLPDGTEKVHSDAALATHRPSLDTVYEGYLLHFRGYRPFITKITFNKPFTKCLRDETD